MTRSAFEREIGTFHFFRRFAARSIGQAKPHARDAARLRRFCLPKKRLGQRQPFEDDAFFFGVRDFAQRARHVVAIAAIETGDGFRALTHRGAHAIHRRVAAADDGDVFAFGIERPIVEVGNSIAQAFAVGSDQIIERGHDALRAAIPGASSLAWLVDAGGDEDGIMFRAQLIERGVTADFEIQLEFDAAIGEPLHAALHDFFLQLEVRDAVDQQSARAVVAVVDRDLCSPCGASCSAAASPAGPAPIMPMLWPRSRPASAAAPSLSPRRCR